MNNDQTEELKLEAIAGPTGSADAAIGSDALPDPRSAALSAVPIAMEWVRYAINMLSFAQHAAVAKSPQDPMGRLALKLIRRHFHTHRLTGPITEVNAIQSLRPRFEDIRRFLSASDAIFISADDETAADNTRGYFGSDLTVAAYAYSRDSIAFTSQFPPLGPRCKAAVIIHQLAHYIDSRVTDSTGVSGAAYDALRFETALLNVHCYPNFAVNAFPPYLDERYGMTRPAE